MYRPVDAEALAERTSIRRMEPLPADMPAIVRAPRVVEAPAAPRNAPPSQFDVYRAAYWLRRRLGWIFLAALLGALGGYSFTSLAKPAYTVSTEVLVDPSNLKVVPDDLFSAAQQR